jgi:hypothetical protein
MPAASAASKSASHISPGLTTAEAESPGSTMGSPAADEDSTRAALTQWRWKLRLPTSPLTFGVVTMPRVSPMVRPRFAAMSVCRSAGLPAASSGIANCTTSVAARLRPVP